MAWLPIAQTVPQYHFQGEPASGFVLKFYAAGTSTNIPLATDSGGLTTASDVVLNADGYPDISNTVFIPHLEQEYKIAMYPNQAAADSNTGAIWNPDNLHPAITADTASQVTISANDTTTGYLNGKLTAGSGVSLVEENDGGDENLKIDTPDKYYNTLALAVADVANLIATNVITLAERTATFGGGFTGDVISDPGNALATATNNTNIIALNASLSLQIRLENPFFINQFGNNVSDAQAMLSHVDSVGGGDIYFTPGQTYSYDEPLHAISNTNVYANGATINNTAAAGWNSHCLLVGIFNKEDVARSKGVEETAHSLGVLSENDTAVTIGLRWNDTGSVFNNTGSYTPIEGDLVIVCTTDDTVSEPTAPVPSVTHVREVTSVSGLNIVIDKGVVEDGTYMIIPISRGLGYDRTPYGGVGRVSGVKDFNWYGGTLESDNGYPSFTGAVLRSNLNYIGKGLSLAYGNGAREVAFNTSGVFYDGSIELAIGSECSVINCTGLHEDTGLAYTTSIIQLAELCIGCVLNKVKISGGTWDGADAMLIQGNKHRAIDVDLVTGATSRLLIVGTSLGTSNDFYSESIDINGTGVITGRLVEASNSDDIVLSAKIQGNTSNADATLIAGTGTINKLNIVDDNGIARITGGYIVNDLTIPNGSVSLIENTTKIEKSRIRGRYSKTISTETYAATLAPTTNFQMVLTGDLEIQDPSGSFEDGDSILIILQQDVTASRTVTFAAGSLYRGITAPGTTATASLRWTGEFTMQTGVWIFTGGSGTWG